MLESLRNEFNNWLFKVILKLRRVVFSLTSAFRLFQIFAPCTTSEVTGFYISTVSVVIAQQQIVENCHLNVVYGLAPTRLTFSEIDPT